MPATPRVPKLTFHSTSGQARVRLGGRQVYLGKHGSPEATVKYHRLIAEYLRTGEVPSEARPAPAVVAGAATAATDETSGDAAGRTIDEVVLPYWKWAQGHYVKDGEPTSEVGVLKVTLRRLRELYGSTPADAFGPLKLKAYRDQLVRDDLSRPGCNERVERMFKWAVSEATLPPLPPIVGDMVRLQLLTGMRPSAVCSLRPRDVERSKEVWSYRPASHKTQHHG